MNVFERFEHRNTLLETLPEADQYLLSPALDLVPLPKFSTLVEPDTPFDGIYFPVSGVVSSVAVSASGRQAEAGLIGREGLLPVAALFGLDRTPLRHIVQIPGAAYRIDVATLRELMAIHDTLRVGLTRFAYANLMQITFTSLANAVHTVEERLARWLLMCDDRMDQEPITLTHDFLSMMLSVRRSSITEALHILEGNGLIRSTRGSIVIRDRAALERVAADCYGRPESERRRAYTLARTSEPVNA